MSLTASTALTTPFAYASSCANIPFSTTSLVSEFYWADEIITVPFLVSDQADERFSSCQPPGWDSGPGKSSFSFSPAVCPSDWTAYSLSRVSSTLSTAHCCDRGYTLDWPIGDLSIENIVSPACFKTVPATATPQATVTTAGSDMFSAGMQVHNAWRVAWASSDAATLSPTPPQLTCREALVTWVPGEESEQECQKGSDERHQEGAQWSKPLLNFIMIGVPILGVAILACIGACCWYACREQRKDRRARKAAEARVAH